MNTNAIDKIIRKLSIRDFSAAWNRLTESQKRNYRGKKYGQFLYTLGADTLEAVEMKRAYVNHQITIEELKAWCLRWNLTHDF